MLMLRLCSYVNTTVCTVYPYLPSTTSLPSTVSPPKEISNGQKFDCVHTGEGNRAMGYLHDHPRRFLGGDGRMVVQTIHKTDSSISGLDFGTKCYVGSVHFHYDQDAPRPRIRTSSSKGSRLWKKFESLAKWYSHNHSVHHDDDQGNCRHGRVIPCRSTK